MKSYFSIEKKSAIDIPYVNARYLIITAEDFGASKNINEGIRIAADQNVITTVSALTNFSESLPELKKLSESHPDIGIGAHLNITTGKPLLGAEQVPSLTNSKGNFYTIDKILPKLNSISPDELRKELKAQVIALSTHAIRLDHLSDHNGILTLYSPFFDVIMELAKEFNVPVRTARIASIKYPYLFANSHMKKRGMKMAVKLSLRNPFKAGRLLKYTKSSEMEAKVLKMDELGILHPDLLIDSFWGNPSPTNFNYILKHLPIGISELLIHPGTASRQGNYPSGLELDYFKYREKELKTLTDENLKISFFSLNIKTIGFSDISRIVTNQSQQD